MTKNRVQIYERVMRRLLRESASGGGFAAYVKNAGRKRMAVLYGIEEAKEYFEEAQEARRTEGEAGYKQFIVHLGQVFAQENRIKGVMVIESPSDPCWGAWEVVGSAAPGGAEHARITYALGYAMSDSGRLMSDRLSVSAPAKAAWARQSGKRKVLPFDDVGDPKTPSTEDDCNLYRGKSGRTSPDENPQLQNAYESRGDERETLARLTAAHEDLKVWLATESGGKSWKMSTSELDAFETALLQGGNQFFSLHYPGGAGD